MSTSGASYEFTVRFYEFCNPLGLQCGGCENGGPPACCDDVQRTENCSTIAPRTCDTRIRFLLRPFGSSVKSAPNTGYRYFTPSNGGNSEMFSEGPGGLLGLPNPFVFNRTEIWTVSYWYYLLWDFMLNNCIIGENTVSCWCNRQANPYVNIGHKWDSGNHQSLPH